MADSRARMGRRSCPRSSRGDWNRLTRCAREALERRFAVTGELTPQAVAAAVIGVLPRRLGRLLWNQLKQFGWLEPDKTIPFDVLDGADCPPAFSGDRRELVRLAVFGLPGQGLAARDRRRHDLHQQLCAQIMSSAVDEVSLQAVAARVLGHPEVCADALLASMLRSFIAERESVLRTRSTPAQQHSEQEHTSKLQRAFDLPPRCEFPSREETLAAFARLQRDFDGFLAQFEENRAELVLDKMREVRRRYPVHIPAGSLQECEEQYDQLLKRAGTYRRQIKELAQQGAEAAQSGDQKTAAWVMRRLEAIHMLLPNLLPDQQLEHLHGEISRSEQDHESEEATRELMDRERAVAAKIKNLAGVIHRFHEIAGRVPPDSEIYLRAQANYHRAVEEIRVMDTEWLTGLVLQLETLLEDLDDPVGKMQSHLDRFIASVRTALNHLCLEIRAHQDDKSRPQSRDNPPSQSA